MQQTTTDDVPRGVQVLPTWARPRYDEHRRTSEVLSVPLGTPPYPSVPLDAPPDPESPQKSRVVPAPHGTGPAGAPAAAHPPRLCKVPVRVELDALDAHCTRVSCGSAHTVFVLADGVPAMQRTPRHSTAFVLSLDENRQRSRRQLPPPPPSLWPAASTATSGSGCCCRRWCRWASLCCRGPVAIVTALLQAV